MRIRQRLLFALMLGLGLLMLYPLFFALLSSVSTNAEYIQATFMPIPKAFWKRAVKI